MGFARPASFAAALALGIALSGPACAESPAPASAPATAATSVAPPVPLLWKVSDADNALYLLGSFHMLKPGDYPLAGDVDAALADAEVLVFELSPEEMGSPALGMQMAQAAMRTDGTTLDAQVGAEVAAKLDAWTRGNAAALSAMGLTGEVLQRFEPWFVGLMVSVLEMQKMGLDPALGLDRHFMAHATESGKPGSGLETGAQQIALFDAMGEREQVQMLEESLDQAGEGRERIEALHAAWRAGDVDRLWTGMAAELKRDYPALYRSINVERNDAWLPKLAARLDGSADEDVLVVVGALHLLGEDGVVEKLRDAGYEVERICSACE
ncbi:TraB/GumN family protein [Luteimonas pelagia]